MNIEKQSFNTVDVLYDDKKWGKRIDPDEWNSNFKVLEEGHNELAQKLNQQVSDIDNAIQSVSEYGGSNVKVNYGGASETLQGAVDNIVSDIENRYTKAEVDATIGSNTNSLLASVEYNESTGVFIFIKKDGSRVVFDTVLEKVPAKMYLSEYSNGFTYLVIQNVDGSTTKTNVTNLLKDTIVSDSDTIKVVSTGKGVSSGGEHATLYTEYTVSVRDNSIGLSHIDTELTTKFEETQTAKNLAVQAKDNAVSAKTASETAQRNSKIFADKAEISSLEAHDYAEQAKQYANSSQGYANQSESYKNSAEFAKVAAEKARDEAQAIAGGDYTTKADFNNHVNDTTLHTTADEKTKLAGIEANANNYTHPDSHPAAMITEDSTHRFVTDTEKNTWSEKEVFIATLTFTITDGVKTPSCNKTFDEIKAANDEGKICILKSVDATYFLSDSNETLQVFFRITMRDVHTFTNLKNTGWVQGSYSLPPKITSADKDKILTVDSSGYPSWTAITNAEGVAY